MNDPATRYQTSRHAKLCRQRDQAFGEWAVGYGVVSHDDQTQVRVRELVQSLRLRDGRRDEAWYYRLFRAADRLVNAGKWLVAHMSYAQNIYLDGRDLAPEDFKPDPQGHAGGALNMVPAYVGYLLANALTGETRSWLMGQGHCVAAIDALNVLLDNMSPAHAQRYGVSDDGLSQLARDFYAYLVRADGRQATPLGSHVNAHTAGGVLEGGYLGFAELQWVHMPLPEERLVAFLSDGAFEEQRGGDWAPRWWRAEDCGTVCPVLIANGRRIDQRTSMAQTGGTRWLSDHLRLNNYDPITVDGRDPAAIAWAICSAEERLATWSQAIRDKETVYPIPLPYVIAETVKGSGFPGAGTNRAHNLPLSGNPAIDAGARAEFHKGARALWVARDDLGEAASALLTHQEQSRPRERDHALARRDVAFPQMPAPGWRRPGEAKAALSPMAALDEQFCQILKANPRLRPRIGNPDEMRSNRMDRTLDLLKHRVADPEPGIAESIDGGVITALNEEAVVGAALANKGGINLAVSYEAFAVKMLGAIRQELIFARHRREAGYDAPRWLSVPIISTSHTWENGKNELSHQDPTLAEAMLGEMSDHSRVVFPADSNTAIATLRACYQAHAQIWNLVVPKNPCPDRFDGAAAEAVVRDGAARLRRVGAKPELLLVAVGAYQLAEALAASTRLEERGLAHDVVYLYEPGRFRIPRDRFEGEIIADEALRSELFPDQAQARVFLVHTRPEPLLGTVRPLDTGAQRTRCLGFVNHGGTFDVPAMLYANRCTWAHALLATAHALERDPSDFLDADEVAAASGTGDPYAVIPRPGSRA